MCSIFHFSLHLPAFQLAIAHERGDGSKKMLANFSAGINQQHPLVFNKAMQLYTSWICPNFSFKTRPTL